jgi:50S ribosomal protein L16 3-hydroxylase
MTYSIGFRAPTHNELAAELLQRLAEFGEESGDGLNPGTAAVRRRRTFTVIPDQPATATPAALPADLAAFAGRAVEDALKDPLALAAPWANT